MQGTLIIGALPHTAEKVKTSSSSFQMHLNVLKLSSVTLAIHFVTDVFTLGTQANSSMCDLKVQFISINITIPHLGTVTRHA